MSATVFARIFPRLIVLRSKTLQIRQFSSIRTFRVQRLQNSRVTTAAFTLGLVGSLLFYERFGCLTEVHADTSRRDTRHLTDTTSQHEQVLASWKFPGVYAWGNNKGRVVAPDFNADYIKHPRRLRFFDNVLLRDLKGDSDIGVAVAENGDVLQWGNGYCPGIKQPELTLKGKDIQKVVLSADRIFALSKGGEVFSFPKSKKEQQEGYKPQKDRLWFLKRENSNINYKEMKLPLGHFERVSDISSGLEHLLYLTSHGRLFSSAAAYTYPSRGQLGVPKLNWSTRPKDRPYDTPHEVLVGGNCKIVKIATGDFHSLAFDTEGRIWVFGDNTYGQLGFPHQPEFEMRDIPTALSIQGLYPGKGVTAKCTDFAAGGLNSYFMVDAKEDSGAIQADVFASGQGLWGTLGNGQWIHTQGQPAKIKSFSGIMEYNDQANSLKPLRVAYIRPSATHVAAVLDTASNVTANGEAYYGKDALWWGSNEFYQLGTGKRSNVNVPTYIAPLGVSADVKEDLEKPIGPTPQIRLQVTPRAKVALASGKKVDIEQAVVTGKGVSVIYSRVVT